jgi:acyl-CoA thioester hydrolase
MTDPLADFPVVVTLDVPWADMDAFGHVNNVAYFRYFEQSRIAFLGRTGWMPPGRPTGIGPIVHSTQARFRRPLAHPDRVHVGTRLAQTGADRVTLEHVVVSERHGETAADGWAVVVCFDYAAGAKAPIPADIAAALARLAATSART